MKTRYFWFPFLGGFLIALLCSYFVVKPFLDSGTDVFKPTYQTLTRNPYKIPATSNKIRLVSYWATWCKPCIAEFRDFQDLKNKYPYTFEVIAVSDEKPFIIEKFRNKNPYDFIFLTSVESFNSLGINAVPVNVILNKNGKAIYSRVGGLTAKQIEEFILEN